MPEITFRGTPEECADIARVISETFANRGQGLSAPPEVVPGRARHLRIVTNPAPTLPGMDSLTAGGASR